MSYAVDPIVILACEDAPDDRLMMQEAFEENCLLNELFFVEDGVLLLDYLHQRGDYNADNAPRPGIILLDINLPRKNGREALAEIKADPTLRSIPVVMLTSSKVDEDILRSYELGVSGYIVKPVTFEQLAEVVKTIGNYWLGVVQLPPSAGD